jgi:hypothetical protein
MNLKTKKLGFGAVLIGALTAGAIGIASAHGDDGDRGGRRAAMLQKFDANHDGVLSDAEKQAMRDARKAQFEARKQEMLAKFDANRDGVLSDAERQAMRDARVAERFAKLDTDGNGSLSPAEFKAGAGKMMMRGRHHGGGHRHGGERGGRGGWGGDQGGDQGRGQY